MAYAMYINDMAVDMPAKEVQYTRQVSDLAQLTKSKASMVREIVLPPTSRNVAVMKRAGLSGVTSDVPYRRTRATLVNLDTGEQLIRNGWLVLLEAEPHGDGYKVAIYDGLIEMYKRIENLKLSDLGLDELTHYKTLENIAETWTDDTPYCYVLADFNGDNRGIYGGVNTDYQVPSVLISYLWDKIFAYIGMTYSGEVFAEAEWSDTLISYPKPTPQEEPEAFEVFALRSYVSETQVTYPSGTGIFYGSVKTANLMPAAGGWTPNAYYSPDTGAIVAGVIRLAETTGGTVSNSLGVTATKARVRVVNAAGVQTHLLELVFGSYVDVMLNVGDKFYIDVVADSGVPVTGGNSPGANVELYADLYIEASYINGYSVGFDRALIDFQVVDFMQAIFAHFELTAFPDGEHVEFRHLGETLKAPSDTNWSRYLVDRRVAESYQIGAYAQRNEFKYQYNDGYANYYDGALIIDNENLDDRYEVHASSFFSPLRNRTQFLGGSNVYPIWEREVNDNGEVEYQGLENRFYIMRRVFVESPIIIASAILAQSLPTTGGYFRESFEGLRWTDILNRRYKEYGALLNLAKARTFNLALPPRELREFDFKRLVYLDYPNGWYYVNKIVSGKANGISTAEMFKVDKRIVSNIAPDPAPYIRWVSVEAGAGCTIDFEFDTTATLPSTAKLRVFRRVYGVLSELTLQEVPELTYQTITIASDGTASISSESFPAETFGYVFKVEMLTSAGVIDTGYSDALVLDGSCFIPADWPDSLEILSSEYLYSVQDPLIGYGAQYRYYRVRGRITGAPAGAINVELHAFAAYGYYNDWSLLGTFGLTPDENDEFTIEASGANLILFKLKVNSVESNTMSVNG